MQTKTQTFYGHGKLLLTGEYAVLDGAKALAIPTKFGQQLEVQTIFDNKSDINWESYTYDNKKWLHYNSKAEQKNAENVMLEKIIQSIKELNPNAFETHSYHFKTKLEFHRKWGLGSSSTLLYCLAKWAQIDAFTLLEKTFGGSGYDIACAGEDNALFYTLKNKKATWQCLDLALPMHKNIFFVYLGKKKNSREAIAHYRASTSSNSFIKNISTLSDAFCEAKNLKSIQQIILEHENLLSKRLKTPSINDTIFTDLDGTAKSLGGWGGDFVLIATQWSKEQLQNYLKTKNMNTLFAYDEMVFKA